MPRPDAVTVIARNTRSRPEGLGGESDRRIGGNLAVLADLIRRYSADIVVRGETLSSRDVAALMGGIAARIDMLGRLHCELASPSAANGINLSACLRSICDDLAKTLPPPGRIVLSHQLARDCLVPAEQALPLALITCEIVGNAVRHAHPADVVGFINVCCWRDPSDEFVLDIADDGVGLPPGFDPAVDSGFGLRLVRQLSEQLGATCVFDDSGLGLHFRLRIPPPGLPDGDGDPVCRAAAHQGRS
jgi:two-component sensor histidine kinase